MGPRVNIASRVARCLIGAVLAVTVVSGCSEATPETQEPDDTATETTGNGSATDPRDESSDGLSLEVVETAVTVTADSTGPMASYVVMLSNPSADIALYTDLEIRLLDGDGEPVTDLTADRDVVNRYAHLIMPGRTQAITELTYVATDTVESVDVSIDGTEWVSAQDDRFMPLSADDVTATADGNGATLTFTVDSPYTKELTQVQTYAIFKDASGKLLGGSSATDVDPSTYVPGVNEVEIDISAGVPPEWDPESTEIYIDPFVE